MDGDAKERTFCRIMRNGGWHAQRAAASGRATDADLPDVTFAKLGSAFCAEMKAESSDSVYIDQGKMLALREYGNAYGMKPVVIVRWSGEKAYYVYEPDTLHVTPEGNYRVKRGDEPRYVFRNPDSADDTAGISPGHVSVLDFEYVFNGGYDQRVTSGTD